MVWTACLCSVTYAIVKISACPQSPLERKVLEAKVVASAIWKPQGHPCVG